MELKEEKDKGLYYNCDQKYSANHHCRSKFLLLLGTYNEPSEESPLLEQIEKVVTTDISSVNALTGQSNPRSFRVIGEIGRQHLHVLIYSGNTHNFIKPQWVE